MTRFTVLIRLVALAILLAVPPTAIAQETGKVARIGVLFGGWPADPFVESFRQGLHDLGYWEGRNISIEYRWGEGRGDRLAGLAAELVRLKVDLIVAASQAALAAKQATTVIPIVMPIITDPVRLGLVTSLARPGGNATGFATQNDELPGKWLELIKETIPRVSRVTVLWSPIYDGGAQRVAAEAAARSLGLRLQTVKLERSEDFSTAFLDMQKNRTEALIVSSSPFFYQHRTRLVALAAKHRLPTIYHQSEFVVGSGGLMSYGPDFHDLFRRSATYVDKILRCAKPEDLPVQQPTKFELVVNGKTAQILGLAIPQPVLLRADKFIE
jgi:putative ABC transport system substrate-binding protein